MHELDQMTPNQRLNAFMTGQSMDRMLAMPVIVSMSGDVCGMTHREKRSSPENEAKCQIEAYKRFGNDLAVIEYGLQYQEFVLPYAKKVNQAIHNAGGMVCYHICGDTTKTIDDMADAGSDMISVDNVVDLEHVKNTAGQKMPILGNVAPVDYFIQGTKEEMDAAVKRCLQKAWDSPNGYILASGCDLSGQVKLENIEAFMNAARKYGKWPLDPKNFE